MSATADTDPAAIRETFYISHGSPTLSIDDTLPARHFLQSWKDKVVAGPRPKAILVISGHWEADVPSVNAVQGPLDTIYDFYGFPKPMYQIKYPAPGAPELANRVKELLTQSGFDRVNVDKRRGLDHGAWVPLMLMYPEADIPVCQLSVQTNKDATYHYHMGKALSPLMDEGVLVLGSGSATHNLRKLRMDDGSKPVPWAAEFDTWLENALVGQRYEEVNEWEKRAPHAKTAHPWPDHFYPLHVAIGAAGGDPKAELVHRSWGLGTLSYASYRFTRSA
ncbi:hypothetical protein V2J09_022603 [Rumex salicifolius]